MRLLPYRFARRKLALHGFIPRGVLARFTLYMLVMEFAFIVARQLMRRFSGPDAGASLDGWISFMRFVLIVLFAWLLLRWIRNRWMWRLRNRLIVTYVFIGVIPVALLVCMALIAGYLFAGNFAGHLVISDFSSELNMLERANSAVTQTLADQISRGIAPKIPPHVMLGWEGQTSTYAWYGDRLLSEQAESRGAAAVKPAWVKEHYVGLAMEGDDVHLRAASVRMVKNKALIVVSSRVFDKSTLKKVGGGIGKIRIFLPDFNRQQQDWQLDEKNGGAGKGNVSFTLGGEQGGVKVTEEKKHKRPQGERMSAGEEPEGKGIWDWSINFFTPYPVTNWATGKESSSLVAGSTRLSALYPRLFIAGTSWGSVILTALVALAVVFAVIELLALFIGLGLTRTITRSVAQLYRATQHINRGDLKHRIVVKSKDQLAELETSFNSMTASLERLLAEQKEKQRIEKELEIAQEVQAQLFPQEVSDLPSLEMHGVCRPARTVSGDYYDFLRLGTEKMVIAVGDISGKGISAALLMATVHSAVRAYEFGHVPAREKLVAAGASAPAMTMEPMPAPLPTSNIESPADVNWLLNRHLYHSTPSEKYATLFLAMYDGANRSLRYCNAGHLPPMVISADGSIRRLDTPGMVIGLFPEASYEDSSITLQPDDIFVAFSDGVTEPENEFGEFGEQRLIEVVLANRNHSLERISEQAIAAVKDWIGANEQPDDITLVLARAR